MLSFSYPRCRSHHEYFLGITSDLGLTEIDDEALKDSQYLYIEGYLVSSPVAKATAIHGKKSSRVGRGKNFFFSFRC